MSEIEEKSFTETEQESVESATQTPVEDTWLHIILGIPYLGDLLTTLIAVAPMVLIILVADQLFGVQLDSDSEEIIPPAEFWLVLLFIPIWYFWLRYLERKVSLSICLPLPIINIKIKWLLIPFGVLWVMMYTGVI